MPTYSIKMRAAKTGKHVSGAERILPQQDISQAVSALTERALHHGLGRADFINVKIEEIQPDELQYLEALPVSTRPAATVEGSYEIMRQILGELGLAAQADKLVALLRSVHPMEIYRSGMDNPAKLPGWKKYVFPIYMAYNGKCRKDALPMKF